MFYTHLHVFSAVTLRHQDCVFTGMDVINDALETAVSGRVKNNWIPVSVNVAPATLTITAKQVTHVMLTEPFNLLYSEY